MTRTPGPRFPRLGCWLKLLHENVTGESSRRARLNAHLRPGRRRNQGAGATSNRRKTRGTAPAPVSGRFPRTVTVSVPSPLDIAERVFVVRLMVCQKNRSADSCTE